MIIAMILVIVMALASCAPRQYPVTPAAQKAQWNQHRRIQNDYP
jgi:hypothetical protein